MRELRERVATLRPAPGRSVRVLRLVVAARRRRLRRRRVRRSRRGSAGSSRRKGFPAPVGQHWVRDGDFAVRLDFAYPDVKVYLEGDGFGFHRYASDLDRDVRKRNGLVDAGLDRPALHVADDRRRDRGDARPLLRPRHEAWRLPR